MRFLQNTLNCTRTKVYRIMVGDLDCRMQAQKLQDEGKLQQMNSCLTASANENVIEWCVDSMTPSSCFSSNHKQWLPADSCLMYVTVLPWSIRVARLATQKAWWCRNCNLYYVSEKMSSASMVMDDIDNWSFLNVPGSGVKPLCYNSLFLILIPVFHNSVIHWTAYWVETTLSSKAFSQTGG